MSPVNAPLTVVADLSGSPTNTTALDRSSTVSANVEINVLLTTERFRRDSSGNEQRVSTAIAPTLPRPVSSAALRSVAAKG